MTDQDTELTAEESRRLQALRNSPAPPDALEERTVGSLYRSGLLETRARGRNVRVYAQVPIRLAAAAAIFGLGLFAGTLIDPPLEPRYVLLLDARDAPESDEDSRVSEYAQWARHLREEGVGITGARLAHDLEVVGAPMGEPSVSGFFLIDVVDEARALAIARSCPHTRYGGSVIVGRILP